MTLPYVAPGDPHAASHNAERDAINGILYDLVEVHEDVTRAEAAANDASMAAAEAQASADLATDISNIEVPDDVMTVIDADAGSDFRIQSDARHMASIDARVPAASTTVSGKAELATSAETITGTDGTRVTTPPGVRAAIDERDVRENAAHHGFSTGASAATNTAAITAAIAASSRPLYIPGAPGAVYTVEQITNLPNGGRLIGDGATLRAATGSDTAALYLTSKADFYIDGLVFDGNDVASAAVRFIDCTGFSIGTARGNNGYRAGFDFQECLDFTAETLIADNNGATGGTVGSGVYLRENTTGGTGCKRFTIGAIIGSGNGLGSTLDGQTAHTSGSAATGQIGRIIARNNTRYGTKFQHTGGLVQVGSIYAAGNGSAGFTCPAVNGLEVGLIWSEDNAAGAWFDAAAQNVHVNSLVAMRSGIFGAQIVAGGKNITIDSAHIEASGTTGAGTGSSGRGLDIRGVTRTKIGSLTVIDAGSNTPNTTNEALYVDGANCVDLQLGNVTLLDTRASTARCAYPANFSSAAFPLVQVDTLRASGFVNKDIQSLPGVQFGRVSVDDKYASRRSSATILSGTANVTVTHNLIRTPTFIAVTGSGTDVVDCMVDTIGSSTFRIWVPAAVAADRVVYWEAGIAQ